MIKKCIGIISYLPPETKNNKRRSRVNLLNETIKSCDESFDLPIIIIAQNWKDDKVELSKNCIVYHYEKLGIPLARNTLRQKFLESGFDYLIMLDDDCVLSGNGEGYLKELDENPNCVFIKYINQLKLFAISKHIYSQVEMPNVDAEKNEGVEDEIFINIMKIKFKDKFFTIKNKDVKIDYFRSFQSSTWRTLNTSNDLLIANTDRIIKELEQSEKQI